MNVAANHIIVVDRNEQLYEHLRSALEASHLTLVHSNTRQSASDFDHIVDLRRHAIALTTSEKVAFIDDDDEWDRNHLERLSGEMDCCAAVLSAARLVTSDGRPALFDFRCPWASTDEAAASQFSSLCEIGVYERGTSHCYPVIKEPLTPENVYLMTSCSIFSGPIIRKLSLRHLEEASCRKGEIHDLCYRILSGGQKIKCLRDVTTTYHLGGFSNGSITF